MDTHQQYPIRVVLIDSYDISRAGLKYWLEQESNISVIGETGRPGEIFDAVLKWNPDVAVLHYTQPVDSAVDLVVALKNEGAKSKIVAIGNEFNSQAANIIQAGADAFLLLNDHREIFISAIHAVVQRENETWLSPSMTKLQETIAKELQSLGITPMERKVLRLLDNDNRAIARRLCLATGTIRNHVSNIYFKLQVPGRKEAIQAAKRLGLIDNTNTIIHNTDVHTRLLTL